MGGTSNRERAVLITCIVFTAVGAALTFAGLFVPYWVEVKVGAITHSMGIWLDRVCTGDDCELKVVMRDGYERTAPFPEEKIIRWFETVAAILAGISIGGIICTWMCQNGTRGQRVAVQAIYFPCTMIAGFLSVTGTLILSSKDTAETAQWGAFLSGIGGALLFIAGSFTCTICRDDPTYGTLENPVSPKYIVNS